jgi:propionyl-CoA carboxylase alpha chain
VASPASRVAHLVAATLWAQAARRREAGVLRTIPSGFRNAPSADQATRWRVGDDEVEVTYRVEWRRGPDAASLPFRATIDGTPVSGRVLALGDDEVDLELGDVRSRCRVHAALDALLVVSGEAQTVCSEAPRFVDGSASAGLGRGPAAPVPGTVVRVEVMAGDKVTAGQALVVLEAMKLEHTIRAEADAIIAEVPVVAGQKVDAHQILVVYAAPSE